MNDMCPQNHFIPAIIPIPRYKFTPLAKSYIIFQRLGKLYSPEEGLHRGTMFPELDIPYEGVKQEKYDKYDKEEY